MSGHGHAPEEISLGPLPRSVRIRLLAVVVPLVAATLAGIVTLWPSQDRVPGTEQYTADTVTGTVTEIRGCAAGLPEDCVRGLVELSHDGATVEAGLPYGPNSPEVDEGDRVVLAFAEKAPEGQQYVWSDFDRSSTMLVLVVVFVLAVVFLSRWQGVGSLFALAISLGVVFLFVLPGLSQGGHPTLIAVTGAAFIMILALYVTHGVTAMTSVAVIGTLLSLLLTAGIGLAFTSFTQFTGLADESNRFLFQVLPEVRFEGLLLAGLIIGALGVLDDITVTQAAAVWELADADRRATRRQLFARAMRIGRAHVSATVNTLMLAYVGAALPLLLTFSAVKANPLEVALTDSVSQELVRGLVGSLGIVAAVPITTVVAVAVATAIVHQGYTSHRG